MKQVTYHTIEDRTNYVDMIPPDPKVWEWVQSSIDGDIHIFEDTLLPEHSKFDGKIKVACIIEAPAIYDHSAGHNPSMFHPHKWIEANHNHFQYVISPYKNLKQVVGDKYKWIPVGGSRIQKENFGMWEKERLLSIVASHKRWTEGHKLRHTVIEKYKGKMDVYGSGYNDIIDTHDNRMGKILATAPYYFSLAIMNSKTPGFFTEVLTDVLATGCIPIWWGADDIKEYFNMDGIITFNTLEELDEIMTQLSPALYQSKTKAILENIELSKEYYTRFDWIYKHLKPELEQL